MTEDLSFLAGEDDEVDAPEEEKLRSVTALANKQLRWQRQVATLEEELKEARSQLRQVQEVDLPDAMQACNLAQFRLADGTEIEIKKTVEALISEARRDAAFAWLRQHGHGSLIKNEVIAIFGNGEDNVAQSFAEQLLAQGLKVKKKETVHGQTLKAWAREQDRNGEEMDEELFGIHRVQIAQITPAEK